MAETISGNNSKSMVSLPLCEMLRDDRHSNTDPNVAIVAAILSTVPSTADRMGDRICAAAGDDFLLFCFCPFAAICRSCWVRLFDLTGTLPVGFVPIVGRTIARSGGELLKADGKLKVTGSDDLQNSTSLMRGAGWTPPLRLSSDVLSGRGFACFRLSPIGKAVNTPDEIIRRPCFWAVWLYLFRYEPHCCSGPGNTGSHGAHRGREDV